MSKIVWALSLLLISTYSFATANFTSGTGVFLVPDVSVDGTKNYKSVTLQLNFANNTFTILDATPKDTSFSPTALETVTENGLKVDFHGCARSGNNQITCLTKIVSTTTDMSTTFNHNNRSQLFDNLGRQYAAEVSAYDINASFINANLVLGVPVEVKYIFKEIDIQANSVSAFKPSYLNRGANKYIEGNFRSMKDINF